MTDKAKVKRYHLPQRAVDATSADYQLPWEIADNDVVLASDYDQLLAKYEQMCDDARERAERLGADL